VLIDDFFLNNYLKEIMRSFALQEICKRLKFAFLNIENGF